MFVILLGSVQVFPLTWFSTNFMLLVLKRVSSSYVIGLNIGAWNTNVIIIYNVSVFNLVLTKDDLLYFKYVYSKNRVVTFIRRRNLKRLFDNIRLST